MPVTVTEGAPNAVRRRRGHDRPTRSVPVQLRAVALPFAPMTLRYRDGTRSDAPLLARLFADSFTDTFGHLYRPQDLAAFLDESDEEAWRAELQDPKLRVRIAEDDGEAAAFAKVGAITLPVEPTVPAAELRQLYVLPPWQGRGIADTLMRWALDVAREKGAREVYLSVYVDNLRARRFYERYGFVECGRFGFRVGAHVDDERIMKLTLEGS